MWTFKCEARERTQTYVTEAETRKKGARRALLCRLAVRRTRLGVLLRTQSARFAAQPLARSLKICRRHIFLTLARGSIIVTKLESPKGREGLWIVDF